MMDVFIPLTTLWDPGSVRPIVKVLWGFFTEPLGCLLALFSDCSSVSSFSRWESGHLFRSLGVGRIAWLQKLVVHALLGPFSWLPFAVARDSALALQAERWLPQLVLSLGEKRRAPDRQLVRSWPDFHAWTPSVFAVFVLWSLSCFLLSLSQGLLVFWRAESFQRPNPSRKEHQDHSTGWTKGLGWTRWLWNSLGKK